MQVFEKGGIILYTQFCGCPVHLALHWQPKSGSEGEDTGGVGSGAEEECGDWSPGGRAAMPPGQLSSLPHWGR